MQQVLERKPIEIPEIDTESRILAERAKSELGYEGLMKSWDRPLANILRELEIEPYTIASVDAYKKQRLEEATAVVHQLQLSKKAKERNNSSFLAHLKIREKQIITEDEWSASTIGSRYMWNVAPLESYRGAIPEFVVNKALQIKAALPQVGFGIDYLAYHHDPFLTANYKEERYYVEVWDEPKFEHGLLAQDAGITALAAIYQQRLMANMAAVSGRSFDGVIGQ